VNAKFPVGTPFRPPEEPHSPFYPARGLYSSGNATVLRSQLSELAAAGVDSVMLSWWGQRDKDIDRDSQGISTDQLVPIVLDAAYDAGIGVTWHLEPYGGRSPSSVLEDIHYISHNYGSHPAVWRQPRQGEDPERLLPLIFLYDVSVTHSGESHAEQEAARRAWHEVSSMIRGTTHDSILISLLVDRRDVDFVRSSGFDGAYTYFASEGFTQGSMRHEWPQIAEQMASAGKLFFPSVGPGYNDSLIRPWNSAQTRDRDGGAYYDRQWTWAVEKAMASAGVTITSFNEWGEGTQIEGARPHVNPSGNAYADYLPGGSNEYMERTRRWVAQARRIRCEAEGQGDIADLVTIERERQGVQRVDLEADQAGPDEEGERWGDVRIASRGGRSTLVHAEL
jgi:glycoprotein endo-alpha-1,2-mannosidase